MKTISQNALTISQNKAYIKETNPNLMDNEM